MKQFRLFVIFLLIGAAFSQSDTNDGPILTTVDGTVPFIVSFTSTGSDGDQDAEVDYSLYAGTAALDGVVDNDYDRASTFGLGSYFEVNNVIAVGDFDANHYMKVYLTKGGWGLPSGHVGLKAGDGTDNTEYLVKVTVTNDGSGDLDDGLVTVGDFTATDFVGLDENPNLIIQGGSVSQGVESGVFNVDARLVFDWKTDMPGLYSVQLTMTVVDGANSLP